MRLRARREILPTISIMRSAALAIVADDFVDFVGEEIAHRALNQIRLFKNARGRRIVLDLLLDPRPLLEQKTQVAHEIAGSLAFTDGANDHADAVGDIELAAKSCAAARAPLDLRSCARYRCDRCTA